MGVEIAPAASGIEAAIRLNGDKLRRQKRSFRRDALSLKGSTLAEFVVRHRYPRCLRGKKSDATENTSRN